MLLVQYFRYHCSIGPCLSKTIITIVPIFENRRSVMLKIQTWEKELEFLSLNSKSTTLPPLWPWANSNFSTHQFSYLLDGDDNNNLLHKVFWRLNVYYKVFKAHRKCFLKIEVKFTWNNYFKVYNSVAFTTFVLLCNPMSI